MSGAFKFSDGDSWLVSGWVWRLLLERSLSQSPKGLIHDRLEQTLYIQGLNFASLEDTALRTNIARVLLDSARELENQYQQGEKELHRSYGEALRELISHLEQELALPR